MQNPLQVLADSRNAALETDGKRGLLCQLATVDENGFPRVRTIIMHDLTDTYVSCIYSNFHNKTPQLETGKYQVFVWHPNQGNQFLLNGAIEPMPVERLQEYWDNFLITGAKHLDKFYETSSDHRPGAPFEDRATLEAAFHQYQQMLIESKDPLLMPEHVMGVHFVIDKVEHLHVSDKDGRFHERTMYDLIEGKWQAQVVVP